MTRYDYLHCTCVSDCSSTLLLSPLLNPPATPSAVSSCYPLGCILLLPPRLYPPATPSAVSPCYPVGCIPLLPPRLYPPATPSAVSPCYHRQCSLHQVPSFRCCCSLSSHLLPPTACFFLLNFLMPPILECYVITVYMYSLKTWVVRGKQLQWSFEALSIIDALLTILT